MNSNNKKINQKDLKKVTGGSAGGMIYCPSCKKLSLLIISVEGHPLRGKCRSCGYIM